jgi:hypothetical protein
VNGTTGEDTKAAGSGDRAALSLSLDGEGVLEPLHPCLQVVEALLLRGQQEFFDPFEAFRHLLIQCVNILLYCLDILFAGHRALYEGA